MVGLSATLAVSAAHLADGHYPHPQHCRACGGSRLQRSLAQYPNDTRKLSRAVVHRTVLRELSPRASSAVLRALLQPAPRPPHPLREPLCGAHGGAAELRHGVAAPDPPPRISRTARGTGAERAT